MLKKNKKFYSLLLGIGVISLTQAQIGPATPNSPTEGPTNAQIDAVLQGPNLQIINSNLKSGDRNIQIRTFTNGSNANFGMDKGVVFSTGDVTSAFDKNVNLYSFYRVNHNHGTVPEYRDPDLIKITDKAFNDVVAYEFEIKLANTVSGLNIAYQFGSEEYPKFVGSKYNDAFGFFISGPGLAQTVNMARLPNGKPTTINTVNQGYRGWDTGERSTIDGGQASDYINNGHIESSTVRAGYYDVFEFVDPSKVSIYTEYNGMTKLINYSIRNLTPGGTYKFKIIIADTADDELDSAVFLKNLSAFADLQANNNYYEIDAGGTSATSILSNDTTNGKVVTSDLVRTTAGANIPTGFSINNEGKVVVASNVAAGTYTFDYTICDPVNTDFCSTATVTVKVNAKPVCHKPSTFTGQGVPTKVGISTIGQPNTGWPENIPNGHLVMESKQKGFAITQVASVSAIANPVEGMLVYDRTENCVKLYNGTIWKCLEKSCD